MCACAYYHTLVEIFCHLTQTLVALKVLPRNSFIVTSEIDIMKSLSHPNVIQLYQIINTTVNTYLVIGYRSRRELLDRVQEDGHLCVCGGGGQLSQHIGSTVHHCHSKCGAWRPEARKYPVDGKGNIKLSDSGLGSGEAWAESCSRSSASHSVPQSACRGKI